MTGSADSVDPGLRLSIDPAPSPVETAALVAVLAALSGAEPTRAPAAEVLSAWAASARPGRPVLGSGARWRLSDRAFP